MELTIGAVVGALFFGWTCFWTGYFKGQVELFERVIEKEGALNGKS
jgi:hypothetical protein